MIPKSTDLIENPERVSMSNRLFYDVNLVIT